MPGRRLTDGSTARIFSTRLGWFFAIGGPDGLQRMSMGYADAKSAWRALKPLRVGQAETLDSVLDTGGWIGEFAQRVQDYAQGACDDFRDVSIVRAQGTSFQAKVVAACRRIGYGECSTYGELARTAGYPRAARAVGTVMAHNHTPLVVPCHRVIASAGRPGGFSSAGGLCLKEQLLALEGCRITQTANPPKLRRKLARAGR